MGFRLLAVKVGDRYVREKEGSITLCGIDKASVWPESAAPDLSRKMAALGKDFSGARIVSLVVTEEEFTGIPS